MSETLTIFEALAVEYRELLTEGLVDLSRGPLIGLLCLEVDSSGEKEDYFWIRAFVALEIWTGSRSYGSFEMESYEIKNETYGTAVVIPREKLEDAAQNPKAMKAWNFQVKQFPSAYATKLRGTFGDLFKNPTSGTGIDGKPLFATDHPQYNAGTDVPWSNTGAGILDGTNWDAVVLEMELRVDHLGNPLYITPTHVVIGPAQRAAARALFMNPTTTGGGVNEYYRAVPLENIIVDQSLGNALDWYVFDLSKGDVRPYIFQNRLPLSQDEEESGYVSKQNAYAFAVRARWAFGLGFPQVASHRTGVAP